MKPRHHINSDSLGALSRAQRLAVERRQNALALVDGLKRAGRTQQDAARIAGVSVPSLWRWRRNIVPRFNRAGRRSVFGRFDVPPPLIAKVQQLRLAGMDSKQAWRSVAQDDSCPDDLAAFLRLTPKIPYSFLRASRLEKERWLVVKGSGFSQVVAVNRVGSISSK